MTDNTDDEDYLPFKIDYVPEKILSNMMLDKNLAIEEKENCMERLKKLLQGDTLSKDVTFEEDFLNAYLIQCKYDERRTFEKLLNYLNFRINHSYLYLNVKFDLPSHPSCRFATFLPRRLSDGSVVVLLEPAYWEPDELPFEEAKTIFNLIFQQAIRNPVNQMSGFHVITDVANTGFRQYKFCTPYNAYLLNHAAFDVLPLNIFSLHLINTNYIVTSLFNIAKAFMPEYFKNKAYIHSSTERLLDYFPKATLPVKYGGTLKDYDCGMPDFLRKANEQHDNFPIGGQKNVF
ncbi:Alpha-tocopherol transfer protein-like [Argiope bruennichi]|uniref:Alpha-tocopherol transfer protein-like n=1 Tax=Argiope bruennichi TaxID=94029 RepID=A0A8T0EVY2_ARGBR|nr:Alpha-tocopherol transfer protein-like [Argiope bruennichi]